MWAVITSSGRPTLREWRNASIETYALCAELIAEWWDGISPEGRERISKIRALHEPLLIRAGLIGQQEDKS